MTMQQPSVALSIRQPWAWLIVNGHKDIENRDWPTRFRGRVLVHAGKAMTRDEYEHVCFFLANGNAAMRELSTRFPVFEQLERGGIVGSVEITDCVIAHPSPWFMGSYGFVLREPQVLPFRPYTGALGFFKVTP